MFRSGLMQRGSLSDREYLVPRSGVLFMLISMEHNALIRGTLPPSRKKWREWNLMVIVNLISTQISALHSIGIMHSRVQYQQDNMIWSRLYCMNSDMG